MEGIKQHHCQMNCIGLADKMAAIIGNTSTTKDKKAKLTATVSDNFLRDHVRVVEQ